MILDSLIPGKDEGVDVGPAGSDRGNTRTLRPVDLVAGVVSFSGDRQARMSQLERRPWAIR